MITSGTASHSSVTIASMEERLKPLRPRSPTRSKADETLRSLARDDLELNIQGGPRGCGWIGRTSHVVRNDGPRNPRQLGFTLNDERIQPAVPLVTRPEDFTELDMLHLPSLELVTPLSTIFTKSKRFFRYPLIANGVIINHAFVDHISLDKRST